MSLEKKLKSEYQKGFDEGYQQGHRDGFLEGKKYQSDVKVDVDEFTREVYIKTIKERFSKKNGKLIGNCPYHEEKTPSCIYDPIENEFFCLSCGENGDGFKLMKKLEGFGEKSSMKEIDELLAKQGETGCLSEDDKTKLINLIQERNNEIKNKIFVLKDELSK